MDEHSPQYIAERASINEILLIELMFMIGDALPHLKPKIEDMHLRWVDALDVLDDNDSCEHQWICADNQSLFGIEICIKCHAVRTED